MPLNAFVAEKRRAIFEELSAGSPPSQGEYDEAVFLQSKSKGAPLLGATRYEPDAILLEFIYPGEAGATGILTVRLSSPERIVFLPVPTWVIESIWQGEIDGTYHFESDATRMLEEYRVLVEPEANRGWFGARPAKRRE